MTPIHACMEEYVPSMEIHFPALASLVLVETNARFVSAKCVSSYFISSLSLVGIRRPFYLGAVIAILRTILIESTAYFHFSKVAK